MCNALLLILLHGFIGPETWRAGKRRWWERSCVSASTHRQREEPSQNWGVILLPVRCRGQSWIIYWLFIYLQRNILEDRTVNGLEPCLDVEEVLKTESDFAINSCRTEICVLNHWLECLLAWLCVHTGSVSISAVTGNCQFSPGLPYWKAFAGKVCKLHEIAEMPFFSGAKQHNYTVHVLEYG